MLYREEININNSINNYIIIVEYPTIVPYNLLPAFNAKNIFKCYFLLPSMYAQCISILIII